jgi:hypothetical protein
MNIQEIRRVMQEELVNMTQSDIPYDPGAVIRDRLFRQCYWEEATWFWGSYCNGSFSHAVLDDLYVKLKQLDGEKA